MSQKVAVNHVYLNDTRVLPYLPSTGSHDFKMLQLFCQLCQDSRAQQLGLMPRTGINNLPFHNNFIDMIGATVPEYDPLFSENWDDITDSRAKEIETLILSNNKKLIVCWSGGIDSTCILAAILKNFQRESLDLVTVMCTPDSMLENPVFYEKHVRPVFKIADANDIELLMSDEFVFVDGNGADTLLMSMSPSLDVCMAVRNGDLLSASWRTRPDALIDYLAKITQSKEFAVWYYEINKHNIESTRVPVETYFDFMWWISFNYDYYNWVVHMWFFKLASLGMTWNQYQSRYIGWFRTQPYQLWSMKNNGANVKHGTTLGSLKHHPKKYIYDYDSNEYYYRYKTKINSKGRTYDSPVHTPFAITDSFEILYLNKDLDRIIELLPTHIKL